MGGVVIAMAFGARAGARGWGQGAGARGWGRDGVYGNSSAVGYADRS